MVSYETAYREAYNEVVDYLASLAQDMLANNERVSGKVEDAARDAMFDVWAAIHGDNSEMADDDLWMSVVLNVAQSRVASI